MGDDAGEREAVLLSAIDPDGPADVVMHLKRTGILLAAWTRKEALQDAVCVMAATAISSVETLLEALGGERPPSIDIEAGDHRMHVSRADRQSVIVLVAAASVSSEALREESDRIAAIVGGMPEGRMGEPARASTRT